VKLTQQSALELLEPMTKDPVDFVRQGAYISLAMILIQQSEAQQPKVASIRELFTKVVADKHEDPMARFGASLAQGIIDAGGRNMTLSLSTRAGTLNMNAIVGMTLFVQFWYWFPLAHGLGLALSPTAFIGVDEQLRVPKIDLVCQAKSSTFAYPAAAKKEVEKKEKKAKPAMLSTTAKARAREKTKKEEKGESMDVDEKLEDDKPADPSRTATPAPKRKAEAAQFTLGNMTRVTPAQLATISFPEDGKYVPLRPLNERHLAGEDKKASPGPQAIFGGGSSGGAQEKKERAVSGSIVLLRDQKPEVEAEFIELNKALWPDAQPEPEPIAEEPAAPASAAGGATGAGAGLGAGGELPGGEADAPPSFEYDFE